MTFQDIRSSISEKQKQAFDLCVRFLKRGEKTKGFNFRYSTYALKHVVERPTNRFGVPDNFGEYHGYISEDTFVAAAKALGYRLHDSRRRCLNISNMSLKKCVYDWAGYDPILEKQKAIQEKRDWRAKVRKQI